MMTNPNLFREPDTGERVCPSACLGVETCVRTAHIAALAEAAANLESLTDPNNRQAVRALWGDGDPIRLEQATLDGLEASLANSCLRYHLASTGELTE